MYQTLPCLIGVSLLSLGLATASAQTRILIDYRTSGEAGRDFRFPAVAPPAVNDAAAQAVFSVVAGQTDPNAGGLGCLNDGRLPAEDDVPAANFFFAQSTDGGRVLVDLGRVVNIKEINTYSWHSSWRAPQVYDLYLSEGQGPAFQARPARGVDPASCGWQRVARVDTRRPGASPGGQYAVSIGGVAGPLAKGRYLLFDLQRTQDRDAFGNTFFSEVDVVDADAPPPKPFEPATGGQREVIIAGGKYRATIDTAGAPELAEWVEQRVVPMIETWYPKMVEMLPSQGFEAPTRFSVVFDPGMQGVASASGTRIRCSASWFRQNLKGESLGALFHEMVHVVQQYGRAPRVAGATRPPVWLTEGITDYLRFFIYEPEIKGAEITARNLARARYDGSYRITANFLNWVCGKHGKDFVQKLNAIIREGRYSEQTWKDLTGSTVEELGAAWRKDLEQRLGVTGG